MAIAHGSTTSYNGSGTTHDITSVNLSGTDHVLVVKIAYRDNGGGEVTGVAWDPTGVNESLTQLGSEVHSGDANAQMWHLVGGTSKTATLRISTNNSVRTVAAASVFTGVHQTTPFRTAATATATGSTGNVTVDVVANSGEWVVDSMCQVSAGPDTATASQTQRHNAAATGGGTDTRGASQDVSSAGATETMSWTMSSNDHWSTIAGALQEAVASTSIKTIDTIAIANVKTIDGIAIASVKTRDTIT